MAAVAIAPLAPTDAVVTPVSISQLDLKWTDHATDETCFVIQRSTGGGFQQVALVPAGTTTFSDIGLLPDKAYRYRVRAMNETIGSTWATASGWTPVDPLRVSRNHPGPSDFTATVRSSTEVDLSWADITTNENRFFVYRSTNGRRYKRIAVLPADTTGYHDTRLVPNAEYRYRLKAKAGSVSSAFSDTVPATTPDAGGSNLIAENFPGGAGGFTVIDGTWSAANGTFQVTSNNGAATTHLNSRAIHETAVAGDFVLTVDARAVAAADPWSNFSVIFGYQDPLNYYFFSSNQSNDAATSGIFRVVGGVSTELADVPATITPGVSYQVRIERTGDQIRAYRDGVLVASASDGTFTSGNVGLGTRQFQAVFDNFVVTGTAVPPPTSPPAPPSSLTASVVSSSRIDLAWSDNSSDEAGFKVERSQDGGATWSELAAVARDVTSYRATGLAPGVGYQFRVRSFNAAGDSVPSGVAGAATPPAPSADRLGPYAKPSASSTGLSNPALLTRQTATLTTTADGQVIENLDFVGCGVQIRHANVIIRNCRFTGGFVRTDDVDALRPGCVVRDCEFVGCGGYGRGVSLYRNYVHGIRDNDFWRNPADCTWEGNYFTDWYATSNQPHMDAAQWYWISDTADKYALNFVVRGNYWDLDANYAYANQMNAVLFVQGNAGTELVTNVTIEYNWFKSGGYVIRLHAKDDASIQINYNIWEDWGWGPILGSSTRPGQGIANIGFTGNQIWRNGTLQPFEKPGGANGDLFLRE
jgi:hypothetical protein